MTARTIPLCSALLFAAVTCLGCSDEIVGPIPISGSGVESLDSVMTGNMRRWDVPGAALAIAWDGRLVHARGYGFADLARSEPLEPDHLFRVASVSKPITGIATLVAVEQGILALDDRAFDVASDLLPPGGPPDRRVLEVTVAQLLHHTGGFDLWGYPLDPLHRMKEIAAAMAVEAPPDALTIARWNARQPLGFDPGVRFAYTNVGYVTLGRVLEAASGTSYEEFVRAHVFEPVGVTRARIGSARRSGRLDGEVEYESFPNPIWESIYEGEEGPVAEPAYGGIHVQGLDASSGWVLSTVDLARLGVAVDGDRGGRSCYRRPRGSS